MLRSSGRKGCRIYYARRPEFERADDKLRFLEGTKLSDVQFEEVVPDDSCNWINIPQNDFATLAPMGSRAAKSAKSEARQRAIFNLFSLGVSTNRDEWVIDMNAENLAEKTKYLTRRYGEIMRHRGEFATDVKWSRNLKRRFAQGKTEEWDIGRIRAIQHRPFVTKSFYDSDLFVDELGLSRKLFPRGYVNPTIVVSYGKEFRVLAVDDVFDLHFIGDSQGMPSTRDPIRGQPFDNITDWAISQFARHYRAESLSPKAGLTREAVFSYVYAVLHNPGYRDRYALNLLRELPRIPFYPDFRAWSSWGRKLLELHIGYRNVAPYALKVVSKAVHDGHRRVPSP
jgi:predicted helicase